MKSIDIARATKPLADYVNDVDGGSVLKNGKPLAVLSSAKGMDAESIALANSPKFARILKRSRARHEAEGGISVEEVRQRLGLRPFKQRKRAKKK